MPGYTTEIATAIPVLPENPVMRFSFYVPLAELTLMGALVVAGPTRGADNVDAADNERILRRAGVGTQPARLLAYFRAQTLNQEEQNRIYFMVRRLGDKSYRVRESAVRDLLQLGPAALPELP